MNALHPALAAARSGAQAAAVLALQRQAGNRATRAAVAGRTAPRRAHRRQVARQHVQLISGRYVGDLGGSDANVREDVLDVLRRLNQLWSISNTDFSTEEAQVRARPPQAPIAPASLTATVAALGRNEQQSIHHLVANNLLGTSLAAPVAQGQPNAKDDVLALQVALNANWNMSNGDLARERAAVQAGPDPVNESDIPQTLAGIARFKVAYVGGTSRRHGPLAGTHQLDAAAIAARDAALITPGTATTSTTVGGVTTVTASPFVDHVNVNGVNKSYYKDLWDTMESVVTGFYASGTALLSRPRVGGGAPGDVHVFEPIGDAAKEAVDRIFGTYGQFGPRFHSGVNLLDASLRATSAENMASYLVDNQDVFTPVRGRHNANHAPGRPERTIAETMKRDYIATGTNRHRLEVIDQTWPALNSGGIVSIQPFEGPTPQATRRVRWGAFQTMIHEYFHSLNHANWYRYAGSLGRDRESVLVEGGASLMTDHAWDQIEPRIHGDAALRAAVEGTPAAYDATVIPPIADAHYHPQLEQMQAIERAVGRANVQAAFLTGRMELMGYPQVAVGAPAPATGTQMFKVPPTGVRTLADVAYQTQTPVDELASLNGMPANAAVTVGQMLRVRGAP